MLECPVELVHGSLHGVPGDDLFEEVETRVPVIAVRKVRDWCVAAITIRISMDI
jgi:hypothetical protein